jgi:uncharacterized transporter YbjL
MFNLKQISISVIVVTLLSWLGSSLGGGDGFLPDKSQTPVGFTSGSLISALILGVLIGLIPWRKIGNFVKKIFR